MKHALTKSLFLTVVICLICSLAEGQVGRKKSSIFGLSAMAGVNLSQIDGDNFTGFDKLGITAGLKGVIELSDVWHVNVELLYSEKGSKFESTASAIKGTKDRAIHLAYAEIPILIVYRMLPPDATTTFSLEAGLSLARLLDTDIREPAVSDTREFDFNTIKDDFESTDLNVVLGVHFAPSGNWGLGLRYSGSLSKFYEDPDAPNSTGSREVVEFLRNFQISALATYRF